MSEVYTLLEEAQYERALDILHETRADLRDFQYYYQEGKIYLLLQRFDLAYRSFEAAIGAEPKARSTHALEGAALSTWLAGDRERAIDEMERAVESMDSGTISYSSDGLGLGPRLRLAALLALSGSSEKAQEVIGDLDVTAGSQYWPVPIAQLLQGTINAAELIDFATTSVSGGRRPELAANRDLCLVEFYVGIAHELKGEHEAAAEMFRLAARRNAILEWEWYLAAALTEKRMLT